MIEGEAVIVNRLGLHARPSAQLTALATRFGAEIWLAKNARRVNAKSIMGVMMLAAARGTTVRIEAEGPDAAEAVEAIRELIASGFGED